MPLLRDEVTLAELSEEILARPLALAWHLLDGVDAYARHMGWALAELGDIELPPAVDPAADVSRIQSAAPLYLASELEQARLLPAAEVLAGLAAGGALRIEDRDAAALLYRFWQGRHERFSREEREAFFARLFGAPARAPLATAEGRNLAFEGHLLALAAAIDRSEPDVGAQGDVAVRTAAEQVLANLIPRAGGMTAFAARDILKAIEAALQILKHRAVQSSVGAFSVWLCVQAIAGRYLREEVAVGAHLRRARSGMLLLTWLADAGPRLVNMSARLTPVPPPIGAAAVTWLQATLELQEVASREPAPVAAAPDARPAVPPRLPEPASAAQPLS